MDAQFEGTDRLRVKQALDRLGLLQQQRLAPVSGADAHLQAEHQDQGVEPGQTALVGEQLGLGEQRLDGGRARCWVRAAAAAAKDSA